MNPEIKAAAQKNRAAWEAVIAHHPQPVRNTWKTHLDVIDRLVAEDAPNVVLLVTQLKLFTELVEAFRSRGHNSLADRMVHYAMAYYSPNFSKILNDLPDRDITKIDAIMAGTGKYHPFVGRDKPS